MQPAGTNADAQTHKQPIWFIRCDRYIRRARIKQHFCHLCWFCELIWNWNKKALTIFASLYTDAKKERISHACNGFHIKIMIQYLQYPQGRPYLHYIHVSKAFIWSDWQCIQGIYFISPCVSWELNQWMCADVHGPFWWRKFCHADKTRTTAHVRKNVESAMFSIRFFKFKLFEHLCVFFSDRSIDRWQETRERRREVGKGP